MNEIRSTAQLFRSLGDPNRLTILSHLLIGPHRIRELTEHLGLAQSTVSAHCLCLAECGLISGSAVGRSTVYRIERPEVRQLLEAAESLLAGSGKGLQLCSTTNPTAN